MNRQTLIILVLLGLLLVSALSVTIWYIVTKFGDGSDGTWSTWEPWGECSHTCNVGMQKRTRRWGMQEVALLPLDFEDSVDKKYCLIEQCGGNPAWGSWSSWMDCFETCGDCEQTRVRLCDSPPAVPGHPGCKGDSIEVITIPNPHQCTGHAEACTSLLKADLSSSTIDAFIKTADNTLAHYPQKPNLQYNPDDGVLNATLVYVPACGEEVFVPGITIKNGDYPDKKAKNVEVYVTMANETSEKLIASFTFESEIKTKTRDLHLIKTFRGLNIAVKMIKLVLVDYYGVSSSVGYVVIANDAECFRHWLVDSYYTTNTGAVFNDAAQYSASNVGFWQECNYGHNENNFIAKNHRGNVEIVLVPQCTHLEHIIEKVIIVNSNDEPHHLRGSKTVEIYISPTNDPPVYEFVTSFEFADPMDFKGPQICNNSEMIKEVDIPNIPGKMVLVKLVDFYGYGPSLEYIGVQSIMPSLVNQWKIVHANSTKGVQGFQLENLLVERCELSRTHYIPEKSDQEVEIVFETPNPDFVIDIIKIVNSNNGDANDRGAKDVHIWVSVSQSPPIRYTPLTSFTMMNPRMKYLCDDSRLVKTIYRLNMAAQYVKFVFPNHYGDGVALQHIGIYGQL